MSPSHNVSVSRKHEREDSDEMDLIAVVVGFMIVVVGAAYQLKYRVKEVPWDEQECVRKRAEWMNSLMNDRICRDQLRMDRRCFDKLCHILQTQGGLVTTRNVNAREVVAFFLHTLAHHFKTRTVQAVYTRSGETVSRQFHTVLWPHQILGEEVILFGMGKWMEILTRVLYDQIKAGNKGEGDWKPQAYQAVVDELRSVLGMFVTVDHVKNRIKSWKKHYAIVTDIRTFTKFMWDDEKKMVVITGEDFAQWNAYCKDHQGASAYQNKRIDNWDDICTLFGMDRAVGDGEEIHEEAAAAVDEEITSEGGSSSVSGSKRIKRDRLADAVTSFADSFRDYVQSRTQGVSRLNYQEIYAEVSQVFGISEHQILRAVKRFLSGMVDEFQMLKELPEAKKLDWVLLCLQE